jgi:hypothetical protein
MRCSSCGANLKPAALKCEICGAERKLLSPEILQIEEKFAELREQFQRGNLDYPGFQTACKELVWIDPKGVRWKYNAADQNWYQERKHGWILADPERHTDEKLLETAQEPAASHPKTPGQSKRPAKKWMYVFGCVFIVLGIIAVGAAGGFFILSQSTDFLSLRSAEEEIELTSTPMPLSPTPVVFYSGDGNGFEDLFKPAKSNSYDVRFDDANYLFNLKNPGVFLTSISKKSYKNLAVDVTVANLGDEENAGIAGFIVRASGTNGIDGILLEIDTAGNWRIEKKDQSGTRQPLTEWAFSDAINTGNAENRIGVVVSGDAVYFLANGVELYSMAELQGEGAYWGLIGATQANVPSVQIQYQNLRVEEVFEKPVDERPNVIARFGKPDSFCVTFEENVDGSISRYDEWTYINQQTIFHFIDGVFMGSDTMDYSAGLIAAPYWYDSFQFTEKTSIDDVRKMFGNDLREMELPSEFGGDLKLFAGDQILVGFANGNLEYVETFAVETPSEKSAQ